MVEAVLVGCGAMSRAWLDAARQIDGLNIVGLVDLDLDRARSRAAEFRLDGADTSASLDAMLDKRRPDAVFDAVVPAARTSIARSAFASGCHLLSEKPLAASLDEARAVVAAARKAGRIHAVAQNRRYHPSVRRIRRFLDIGRRRQTHRHPLRLLPRPAFRRLPRRDGACASRSTWPSTLSTRPAP